MEDDNRDALREERQAAALRKVADLGERRADLLRQADALLQPIGEAVVEAARADAPRRRTQQLAQVGSSVFYGWLESAGIQVRPKKAATTRERRGNAS